MISKLKGTIDELRPTEVVLDVNGVGYDCSIPLSTYEKLLDFKEITLHIHTYHREDQLRLFGFYTPLEKDLFRILIAISGIGPSMALSILSGVSSSKLLEAVRGGNTGLLKTIPGIGNAKAEKLIFELKRRVKRLEQLSGGVTHRLSERSEAVEALMSLGFDEARCSRAVDEILQDAPEMGLESLIKKSLQRLSG
jgi:Holliday junction DNA helicase RuvA